MAAHRRDELPDARPVAGWRPASSEPKHRAPIDAEHWFAARAELMAETSPVSVPAPVPARAHAAVVKP